MGQPRNSSAVIPPRHDREISLYGDDSKKLNDALDLSMKIERLEVLLSVNIPSSDVSLINRASGEYRKVSAPLERALEWSGRTGGH